MEGGTALEVSLAIGGRMFRGRLGHIGSMPLVEGELLVGAAAAPGPPLGLGPATMGSTMRRR
jgi:hypothetical protein